MKEPKTFTPQQIEKAFLADKMLHTNVPYTDLVASVMASNNYSDEDWDSLCNDGQQHDISRFLLGNPELVSRID